MPFTFTMPKLSPTMEDGTVAKWLKKEGDKISAGDVILEIGTDKATVEHSAIDPGYLRKILVKEGQSAHVNAPLAIFSEKIDEDLEGYEPEEVKEEREIVIVKESPKVPHHEPVSSRISASPLARKLAEQQGILLEEIKGTGPRGRIMSRDLEKKKGPSVAPSPQQAPPSLSQMRIAIGKRVAKSKREIPHFYASIDVECSRLVSLREEMKSMGSSLTVNDFVLKATSLALMDFPKMRGSYHQESDNLTFFPHADISVLVSIPEGLSTPIIFSAEEKSIQELSQEMKSLAEKAKTGKLSPHEYEGGAFTITNLGMYGIKSFQAIINPPQLACLAVGAILDIPVVQEGKVVAGRVMSLTISLDHRFLDGSDAAHFLKKMKELLEKPLSLLFS